MSFSGGVEGSLCEADGQSPQAGDAVGPAVSGGQQILGPGDLVEQPERERLAGVQDPAGEQDLPGNARTNNYAGVVLDTKAASNFLHTAEPGPSMGSISAS